MKTFKFFILSICTLFISQSLEARHLLGGSMTYECIEPGRYSFTMTVYRDGNCANCADFDNPAAIAVYNCPVSTNCEDLTQMDAFLSISAPPPTISIFASDITTCMDGMQISNGDNIQKATYEFELSLPISTSKYIVNYQRCCRDEILSNIQDPSNQGFTLFSEITPLAQQECNSSPIIDDLRATYQVCVGELTQIDFSATDDDNDQITYRICSPIQGGGAIVSGPDIFTCQGVLPDPPCPPPYDDILFLAPYHPQSPFSVSDNFSMNPSTGVLQFTSNLVGRYLMAICVDEFRNGQLMSQTTYEFQVFSGFPNPSSSEDLTIANQVTIYPNPANEFLRLSFPQNFQPESYAIKDLNGKSIEENNWSNSNYIRISTLAKGVYFLYLKNEDYAFAKKFVVE